MSVQCLLSFVFLALRYENFFVTLNFKASIIYRFFSICYLCILALCCLRFSLNQKFVIKFSVSFDTDQVERTRPLHVINRDLRSTKKLKERNRTPLSSDGQHTWLEIPVIMMEKLRLCSFKCLTSVAVMACIWCHRFCFCFVLFCFFASA